LGSAAHDELHGESFGLYLSPLPSVASDLQELTRAYAGQLAIISLPVPLDAACNPLIPEHSPGQCQCLPVRPAQSGGMARRVHPLSGNTMTGFSIQPAAVGGGGAGQGGTTGWEDALAGVLEGSWGSPATQKDVDLYMANSRLMRNAFLPHWIRDAATIGAIGEQGRSACAQSISTNS